MRHHRNCPELQKLLYDEDYDVRWAAYISLSKIDKKSLNVIPDLSEKISNRKTNSGING
jgi:HEAT repeat protein